LQAKVLYDHYTAWASAHGIMPVSSTAFGTIMGELYAKEKRGGLIHYLNVAIRGDRSAVVAVK
jgi:hypothetical protein